MRCFPKIVVSLFVALTGAIGSGYAKENQNDSQNYFISERDNIIPVSYTHLTLPTIVDV